MGRRVRQGRFALSYNDRVAGVERIVPFSAIALDPGGRSFAVRDEDDVGAHIPLHRVRVVYKDGRVFWQRPRWPRSELKTIW